MDPDLIFGGVGLAAVGAYLASPRGAKHMAEWNASKGKGFKTLAPQPRSVRGVRIMGIVILVLLVLSTLLLVFVGTGPDT